MMGAMNTNTQAPGMETTEATKNQIPGVVITRTIQGPGMETVRTNAGQITVEVKTTTQFPGVETSKVTTCPSQTSV